MRISRFTMLITASSILALAGPAVGAQVCPDDPQNYIDTNAFDAENSFPVVYDATLGDQFVYEAQPLGDFDGDGVDDMLLSIRTSNSPQDPLFSQAAVVYGSTGSLNINLQDIDNGDSSKGFFIARFEGQGAFDRLNASAAGDINGDGLSDIVLGAESAGPGGEVYVVYGSSARSINQLYTSDLATSDGSQGFVIRAANSGDNIGTSIFGIGDFNGDGNDDLAIAAAGVSDTPNGEIGAAYVYYNQGADQAVVSNLSAIHGGDATQGVMFYGAETGFVAGADVRPAGDVNNDGLGDLLIGARNATVNRAHTYIAFGSTNATTLELNTLAGATGFRVLSTTANPVGSIGSGIGDYNNDGYDDLVVTVTGFSAGDNNAGTVFLIKGRGDNTLAGLEVDALTDGDGTLGITLSTCNSDPTSGVFRARGIGGDFNGDGIDDFIVRAQRRNGDAAFEERIHIVYGNDDIAMVDIDLDSLRDNGLGEIYQSRIQSLYNLNSGAYRAEAGVGDINNDGYADVIVGLQDSMATQLRDVAIGIFGSGNRPPSIQAIPPLVPYANRTITFDVQIFDQETDASELVISGTSADTTIIQDANITFAGTGSTRTMTIKADIVIGETSITLSVADTDGATTTQQFDIFVAPLRNDDGVPPTITLTGSATQTITVNNSYNELGATADDANLGNVSEYIVIDSSAVDTNAIGSYIVTYNVRDEFGNEAVQQSRTVNVVAATIAPPISDIDGGSGGGGGVNFLILLVLLLPRLSKFRNF